MRQFVTELTVTVGGPAVASDAGADVGVAAVYVSACNGATASVSAAFGSTCVGALVGRVHASTPSVKTPTAAKSFLNNFISLSSMSSLDLYYRTITVKILDIKEILFSFICKISHNSPTVFCLTRLMKTGLLEYRG